MPAAPGLPVMPTIDFTAAQRPLEPVPLPRDPTDPSKPGRVLPARDFNLGMEKLWRRVQAGDEDAVSPLLQQCVPGITEAEIDALTPKEALLIIAYCANRLEQTVAALKNGDGAAAAPASTAPSAPTTSTTTPSPASRARSARTGGGRPAVPSSAS